MAATLAGGAAALVLLLTVAAFAYLAKEARQAIPPAGVRVTVSVPPDVRVGSPATVRVIVTNARSRPVDVSELFIGSELLDHFDRVAVHPANQPAEPSMPVLKGLTYPVNRTVKSTQALTIRLEMTPRAAGAFSGLLTLTVDGQPVGRPVIVPVAGVRGDRVRG